MRSERAKKLAESMRFECARSGQIIEFLAYPQRQCRVPAHLIFLVQQPTDSDGAHAFIQPVPRTLPFVTYAPLPPAKIASAPSLKLKAAFDAVQLPRPANHDRAPSDEPNDGQEYSAMPLQVGLQRSQSTNSNPLKLHCRGTSASAAAGERPWRRDIPRERCGQSSFTLLRT